MEIHAQKNVVRFVQPQALQVRNGPFTDIVWPHINHEIRDALQISTGRPSFCWEFGGKKLSCLKMRGW